jgi:hypothetical protein
MPIVLGEHIDRSFYELDHRFTVVDEPVHASSRQLIAYWRACEAKGGMRMGRDIPRRAIARLLSQVMILEPFPNWEDAYVRYAGFGTAKFFGRDVTGLLFSAVKAPDRGGTLQQLFVEARDIVAENRCLTRDHRALNAGVEIAHQEVVTFPICSPGGESRWILSAAFDL